MADIAELNLNLARGLPDSENIDVQQYLHRLDTWSRLVAAKTERGCRCFIARRWSSTVPCRSFACWRW